MKALAEIYTTHRSNNSIFIWNSNSLQVWTFEQVQIRVDVTFTWIISQMSWYDHTVSRAYQNGYLQKSVWSVYSGVCEWRYSIVWSESIKLVQVESQETQSPNFKVPALLYAIEVLNYCGERPARPSGASNVSQVFDETILHLSLENGAKECIVRPPPGDPTIYEVADVHLAVIFLS